MSEGYWPPRYQIVVSTSTPEKEKEKMTSQNAAQEKKLVPLTKEQKEKLLQVLYQTIGVLPPPVNGCSHMSSLEETTDLVNATDKEACHRYVRCPNCLTVWAHRKKDGTYSAIHRDHPDVLKTCWCSKWTKVEFPNSAGKSASSEKPSEKPSEKDGKAKGEEEDLIDKIMGLLF